MFITTSKIINLPVAALDSSSKVGEVNRLIFDPEKLTLMGVEVKIKSFFRSQKKYLSFIDIIDFDKNGLVVKDNESLLDLSELIRFEKVLKNKISILNQKAYTESNKYLGKVFDLLIDVESAHIYKFYLANFFNEQIFTSDKIVKINNEGVFFSDDVIEQTPIAEAEGVTA